MEANTGERFADADPEYLLDAVDDVDTEGVGVEPTESQDMPPEQGDIGSAVPGDED